MKNIFQQQSPSFLLSPKFKSPKSIFQTNISSRFSGIGGNPSSLAPKMKKQVSAIEKSGIFTPRKSMDSTLFKKYYDRGDIPLAVNFSGAQRKIIWKKEPDVHLLLPIFFEGLREVNEPYQFLAEKGCEDLIIRSGNKLLSVLPQLIIPIKKCLETKQPDIMKKTLKKLQLLVKSGEMVGEALVSYYRKQLAKQHDFGQILPVLNIFKNNRTIQEQFKSGIKENQTLCDLILQTLEVLERFGGEDAFIHIKYMIPTYESCMF